jgi:hypothetical protein
LPHDSFVEAMRINLIVQTIANDHPTAKVTIAACLLALVSVSPAEAKGCIKGAIVGGVAGYMAGHGKLGAAAGCVIGHHEASKQKKPNDSNAQAPSGRK